MRALHVDDFGVSLVEIDEPFERPDFTGVMRTLAYCKTVHTYRHIDLVAFARLPSAGRYPVAPAGGSGYYQDLTPRMETWLSDQQTSGDNAIAARKAAEDAAVALLKAIPEAANTELRSINQAAARQAETANEGGEGYVPYYGWSSVYGRQIADKYGLDADALTAAAELFGRAR